MLPRNDPDRIQIAFDDHCLVANAGLILPVTLAHRLGLRELVDNHVDLGDAPGRANAGDKLLTLVVSALAGGDCIDDADGLCAGGTEQALGCVVWAVRLAGVHERSGGAVERAGVLDQEQEAPGGHGSGAGWHDLECGTTTGAGRGALTAGAPSATVSSATPLLQNRWRRQPTGCHAPREPLELRSGRDPSRNFWSRMQPESARWRDRQHPRTINGTCFRTPKDPAPRVRRSTGFGRWQWPQRGFEWTCRSYLRCSC